MRIKEELWENLMESAGRNNRQKFRLKLTGHHPRFIFGLLPVYVALGQFVQGYTLF